MQIVRTPDLRMLGTVITEGHDELVFSKAELATLQRACDIVEAARDRLREVMGWEDFESSRLYALTPDDIVSEYEGRIEL
jgi:hypothetical protein